MSALLPFPSRQLRQALTGLIVCSLLPLMAQQTAPAGHGSYTKLRAERGQSATADHSKFKVLQGPFKDGDGSAVTRACLSCHTKAAAQVMATKHWNWRPSDKKLEGYGKSTHLVNNFCISTIGGNQEACARCHAGYGMKDSGFDYTKAENVDCLVCHDTTGDYEKIKGGYPNPAVPLADIAQKVGRPGNQNCGVCHFFGGGADATKHGDLDDTILKAPRAVDVHLSKQGAGMACTDCHLSQAHEIAGPGYIEAADRREQPRFPGEPMSRMSCAACHTASPHASFVLNRHYRKVACQTCHIPAFARGGLASNLSWTWSTAGKLKEGRPYEERDAQGLETYNTIHGDMVWAKDVKPEYVWYDGHMAFTRLTDTISPARPVVLNPLQGSYADPEAKIWPFKRHDGDQPFDPVLNRFIAPWTAGPKGSGAYWGDYDWDRAIRLGMEKAGLPWSGKYDFVKTQMWWPITHMVAPKTQALACTECHSRQGRLDRVAGFYLPGRDRGAGVDFLGWSAVLLTFCAVAVHGAFRFLSSRS
ncbi:MAG: tetrathionate reductase family octaheme c-type cytochrome [Acidobacteria bacterium]|nr:tetrathionate reductase family octaheme c-type cytochrome [Acidobacteriota bacterium]MBI3487392.1 tetrathionate reductase family octaheme c-type cytochrome [Acidobacteriota bacterium]